MIGLGEIIQVKRKELGLTQERLAEKKSGKPLDTSAKLNAGSVIHLIRFYYS